MRCPLPVRRQPLHRRTNLLRRPRLTTPPLRNRKRPAPDASPPPTKIGRGEAVSLVTTVPCRPILRLAGNTSPRPRVEQVTFSLDRTNTNNNNSHYFLTNNDRFVFHAAAYRSTRPRWFRMIL